MGERRGTKALELWCRRITDGYPGVNVQNMTTSWRDGLAFCAMIHHFRPDLVDFNALDKDDVYGNNELAFRTAEQHLGIPALLDAEDMASCAVPDRLSILTYLSQFYQTFGGLSPSRPAMKRAKEEADGRLASVSGSPQPKVAVRLGVRKEPCVVCGLPVFLAEKLVISRSLYHRTCFRCARCNNQLTLGNYYETEEGQYCCETCPDEEIPPGTPKMHQDYNQTALFGAGRENKEDKLPEAHDLAGYKRALSDEEKSSERRSLSHPHVDEGNESEKSPQLSGVANIRLNFMTSHLLQSGDRNNDDILATVPPETPSRESPHPVDNGGKAPDESDHATKAETIANEDTPPLYRMESSTLLINPSIERPEIFEEAIGEEKTRRKDEARIDEGDASVNKDYIEDSLSSSSVDKNQHITAIATTHDVDSKSFIRETSLRKYEDTKDTLADRGEEATNQPGERLSLVQRRMKIFENSNKHKTEDKKEGGEDEEIMIKKKEEAANLVENILTSNKNNSREIDKAEMEISSIGYAESSQDSTNSEIKKISNEDSSANIDVQYESIKPLALGEDKPITAAVILKKMMENQDTGRETTSVDTSLSNVSGVDLSATTEYPEDLNPFQSDDSDRGDEDVPRKSTVSNKSEKYVSTNPFGSSDEEEEEIREETTTPPRPAARKNHSTARQNKNTLDNQPPTRRRLEAPQISLNPFWSDDEECDSDDESGVKTETKNTPVPKPRKLKTTPEPSPVPRKTSLDRGGLYASNTSINSTGSLITPGGTYRKKKPAPPPPTADDMFSSSSTFDTLNTKSQNDLQAAKTSPRTPRARKMKPAPPPPMSTSTPQSMNDSYSLEVKEIEGEIRHSAIWDDQKNSKDETNRNRQSLSTVSGIDDGSQIYSAPFIDKSAQGKWKRKKGPAPPRPLPHKRKIKVMSVKDVKLELDEIELQQQGLEKQGVRLEQLIRDKCETGQENEEFTSLRVDVEELVLELFALVNEKNELFRRQAELMLLRRQQRLEEEHADVEYQIRCLMSQPEATKTDSDKQREESLIQRLVEIVERRNEIVECLEMDRRREVEEDRSINEQMGLFAAKSKGDLIADAEGCRNSSITKKEKAKDKVKEKKVKKSHKKDADKDVDETEMKLKRNKKKWF